MIDIHSHVLPLVDDGSKSVENSLTLIKECIENGITDLFCTPHYTTQYNKTPAEIKETFNDFNNTVKENGLNINLYLGQEIFVSKDFKEVLKEGRALTLNGGKYVLVEFDYFVNKEVQETVYEIKNMGFVPILAHVERYRYLSVDDVYEIKKVGGLVQVNAESIADGWFYKKKFIKDLFNEGFVDFVASDLHFGRKQYLKRAYEIVKKKFGEDCAEVVFNINGKLVIKG